MNSVLQSLNNIEEFSLYFNELPSLETKSQQQQQKRVYYSRSLRESVSDANVAEELRKVLINLSHGGDGTRAISPECLFLVIWKVVPQFRGHRQHDAHEFLRYMLDRLHTELQCVSTAATDTTATTTTDANGDAAIDDAQKLTTKEWNGSPSITSETNGMARKRSSIVTNVFGGTLQSEVNRRHKPILEHLINLLCRFNILHSGALFNLRYGK